jgi:hypothetical protein
LGLFIALENGAVQSSKDASSSEIEVATIVIPMWHVGSSMTFPSGKDEIGVQETNSMVESSSDDSDGDHRYATDPEAKSAIGGISTSTEQAWAYGQLLLAMELDMLGRSLWAARCFR